MLVNLLTNENVKVLCVHAVFAGDFSNQTNLSHMMVLLVLAGAERVSCSEVMRQDSPFLELRMHYPFVGEWLTTQCASVRSMRTIQVCLRMSELHFGRNCSRVRSTCEPRRTFQILAGDAKVWRLHFNLGRRRAVDDLIVPLVDKLLTSYVLVLLNPSFV